MKSIEEHVRMIEILQQDILNDWPDINPTDLVHESVVAYLECEPMTEQEKNDICQRYGLDPR